MGRMGRMVMGQWDYGMGLWDVWSKSKLRDIFMANVKVNLLQALTALFRHEVKSQIHGKSGEPSR
jgi:hypothetical protein